jgi:hypothetical protein
MKCNSFAKVYLLLGNGNPGVLGIREMSTDSSMPVADR